MPAMTAVDIYSKSSSTKSEFPKLRGLTAVQVPARLPEKDKRYGMGEEGLRAVLREIAIREARKA